MDLHIILHKECAYFRRVIGLICWQN